MIKGGDRAAKVAQKNAHFWCRDIAGIVDDFDAKGVNTPDALDKIANDIIDDAQHLRNVAFSWRKAVQP